MSVLKRFLTYVEIKTKITSVFPFLMTLAYLNSSGLLINHTRSLIFFFGMFFFDLTATTINNYYDSRKNGQKLPFSRRVSAVIMLILLLLSVFFGIWLAMLTDIVVLFLGVLCFLFGIFYSFGPLPISHGPYGEFISGLFYGFLIPAILLYINTPEGLLFSATLTGGASGTLTLRFGIRNIIALLLLSAVPFCLTANIMLANNICDLGRDEAVNRYTLPHYIKGHAVRLFAVLYYISYLSVIVMVKMRFLSPLSLLLLITAIPVQKNINLFRKKQIKEETFIVSIKNFITIITVHIVLIVAGGFLPGWGPT